MKTKYYILIVAVLLINIAGCKKYKLELIYNKDQGTIKIEPHSQDGRYGNGTELLFTAKSKEGYSFVKWKTNYYNSDKEQLYIVIDKDAKVEAIFEKTKTMTKHDYVKLIQSFCNDCNTECRKNAYRERSNCPHYCYLDWSRKKENQLEILDKNTVYNDLWGAYEVNLVIDEHFNYICPASVKIHNEKLSKFKKYKIIY
ncbi:MAG TPA: hypothetical protein PK544_17220 [Spirochaetota bacterium]|nr:hypothetical protein [Spirochaetota bacterium]